MIWAKIAARVKHTKLWQNARIKIALLPVNTPTNCFKL